MQWIPDKIFWYIQSLLWVTVVWWIAKDIIKWQKLEKVILTLKKLIEKLKNSWEFDKLLKNEEFSWMIEKMKWVFSWVGEKLGEVKSEEKLNIDSQVIEIKNYKDLLNIHAPKDLLSILKMENEDLYKMSNEELSKKALYILNSTLSEIGDVSELWMHYVSNSRAVPDMVSYWFITWRYNSSWWKIKTFDYFSFSEDQLKTDPVDFFKRLFKAWEDWLNRDSVMFVNRRALQSIWSEKNGINIEWVPTNRTSIDSSVLKYDEESWNHYIDNIMEFYVGFDPYSAYMMRATFEFQLGLITTKRGIRNRDNEIREKLLKEETFYKMNIRGSKEKEILYKVFRLCEAVSIWKAIKNSKNVI